MDPTNRGPEEYGHDNDRGDDGAGAQRPPRDAVPAEFAQTPTPARTVRLVAGDFTLTVNPVDGSEIEPGRPGEQPAAPARHTAEEREELRRAGRPPVPAGPAAPPLPLLERQEERERLVRLLGRGRSVRLTGPAGSGRSALLDAVAADCAGLAPDGVIRLSGYRRTATELLYELFAVVHSATLHRPDRTTLLEHVRGIGAVVLLDDLEFGGSALDELLDATPECAFLLAATPDVAAPTADSHLEEVFLSGLERGAALELLERAVDRPLTDDEANWAGDLWFESEGLPLRFVQAGALLRQRDALRALAEGPGHDDDDDDADDVFADGHDVPLPTIGEGAAPAALLASRLSESARDALRFAVALGGEVPHQAHLPALVGDTHADAAIGELTSCALLTPVGSRYRLAAGVAAQLEAAGYGEDAVARAHTAAQHYAWWAGHPSVAPARAAAEADAILAAMGVLVPGQEAGHASAAVLLARSAAPAFAAGLHWGAWERTLRNGQEAARIAGEVAEEAYFHHELGVLALCTGSLDRARAELEASIALRGALADKRGTVAGRRALALVADREGSLPPDGRSAAGEENPAAGNEEPASPSGGVPAAVPSLETLVTRRDTPTPTSLLVGARRAVLSGTRRNLVAAGAGALLAVVLGTVVTLGATSGSEDPADQVTNEQSANEDDGSDSLNADEPADDSTQSPAGTPDATKSGKPTIAEPGESGSADDPSTPGDGSSTTTGGGGSGTSGSTTGGSSTTGGTSGGPSTTGGTSTGTTGTPSSSGGSSTPPTSTPSGTPTSTPTEPTGTPSETPSSGTAVGMTSNGATATSGSPSSSQALSSSSST
ncbi:ATP-binding protein [Streptomyces sp. NPDC091376]|uniref:ATP-binding protein n=1 Tax=Streptomyces sp. NPDC091376 TaxID=3365994 RepID=UPI003813AD27